MDDFNALDPVTAVASSISATGCFVSVQDAPHAPIADRMDEDL
jgi:hypothetical protein